MSKAIRLFNSNIIIADDQSDLLQPCTTCQPENFLNANDYSRYLLCCLTTVYHNNLVFYRIPASLKVYHAETFYQTQTSRPTGKMSFNFDAEDASSNGFVHEFQFKQSVDL